ncbi:hypothetical protein J6S39_02010 [Candidatus Saccharibacteria bacterium]|nr:hypothetical protein [Candidatus Saccharibacteria bacterium]
MNKLKKLGIFVVCITLGGAGGFFLNENLPHLKDFAKNRIDALKNEETVVAAESNIYVENFSDIPVDLPDGWTQVKITTKVPAVALGTDFPETYNPGGHDANDGYSLAAFYDENHSYYITVPAINTEVGEKCAEYGYGVMMVSVYDKEACQLTSDVVFYDPARPIIITLKSSRWMYDHTEEKPYFSYSNAAFGSIEGLTVTGDDENEPHCWNTPNEPDYRSEVRYRGVGWQGVDSDAWSYLEFNPYRIKIGKSGTVFKGDETTLEVVIRILDEYKEYTGALSTRVDSYNSVLQYFNDVQSVESDDPERPNDHIPEYADFDLVRFAKDCHGGTVSTSYEPEYQELKYTDTGETEERLMDCTEIMNIQIGNLNIGIVYVYSWGSMDEELVTVTINGKELTYDEVHEKVSEIRDDDLPQSVKIGQTASSDRDSFNYILDLMLKTSSK